MAHRGPSLWSGGAYPIRELLTSFVCMVWCVHLNNSYIPQHEGRMLFFCLGNVTNLLDVTPSYPLPHPLSPPPLPLRINKCACVRACVHECMDFIINILRIHNTHTCYIHIQHDIYTTQLSIYKHVCER